MEPGGPIQILLVEDNAQFAELVQLFLKRHEPERFEVTWKENGKAAVGLLETGFAFDLVLMDYFLPDMNGLEIAKRIKDSGIDVPVVFLTVSKDFDLAVEVMKLGIEDYLVKEEISTPVLPRSILNAIERKKLRDKLAALDVSRKRMEAIQELVLQISGEIRVPLDSMRQHVQDLIARHADDKLTSYLKIISDNIARIEDRIAKLKNLKSDETVTYVEDIKMFDLS